MNGWQLQKSVEKIYAELHYNAQLRTVFYCFLLEEVNSVLVITCKCNSTKHGVIDDFPFQETHEKFQWPIIQNQGKEGE
jgi:hypothetical protein